ncbi:hypothetical protein HERIO_314 [Hepatospora eriocheir]|uniref:Uncharacterized protein n=1 Tax=Hepatospora eriocheir TaxID=1081669 RepID=A0A1X0QDK0_9MICR|nr:hypothetical protein HERIO_314 [Hepatospora eriocheir]
MIKINHKLKIILILSISTFILNFIEYNYLILTLSIKNRLLLPFTLINNKCFLEYLYYRLIPIYEVDMRLFSNEYTYDLVVKGIIEEYNYEDGIDYLDVCGDYVHQIRKFEGIDLIENPLNETNRNFLENLIK